MEENVFPLILRGIMVGIDKHLQHTESEIEEHLLRALYPELGPDSQEDLRSQHVIDYYDMPLTVPDFAFPKDKIAIYCDGFKYHANSDSFQKDRQQSRDLQLQGWCVLRFSGSEIVNDTDAVVATIQRAIKQKAAAKTNRRWRSSERPRGERWEIIELALIGTAFVVIMFGFFLASLF